MNSIADGWPAERPTLRTERLVLRPAVLEDAPRIQELAGAAEIAASTLTIPHPYQDGVAEAWIETLAPEWEARKKLTLAVTTEADGIVGVVGLQLTPEHQHAEIGYWIGVPYWGRGYATEAAGAMIDYGFEVLTLNRIHAHHFLRNPESGKVMVKLGMAYEGVLREFIMKYGEPRDLGLRAILRSDWARRRAGAS